jgi:RNA polymerase primary sigma factor
MSDTRASAGERSTMGLYLQELGRIPRLSREEEQAFAVLAAQGDREARQRLIQSNLRFVIMVAKQYRNRGVPMEDLINEGNIGLIHAAGRFDSDRGIRFVSYAVCWIRQAILKAIRENGGMIRVPRSRAGELPGTTELRAQAAQRTLSLDSPVTDRENSDPLGARLEDTGTPRPEVVLAGVAVREQIGSLLAGLPDREACILQDRFGLAGRTRTSLREAGRKHGLSTERVRQIEKKALRRIRASDGIQDLEVYAS